MSRKGGQVEKATRQVITSSNKVLRRSGAVQQPEPAPSFRCLKGVLGVTSV